MVSKHVVRWRRTRMAAWMRFAAAIALAAPCSVAAQGAEPTEAAVERLVRSFLAAQRDREVAALRRLTAPGYQEVSPIGDVDQREAMIGFYAPAPVKIAPRIEPSEFVIRRIGDTAIATVRLTFALPPPRPGGAMRVTYVAGLHDGHWLLDAVQYTPIRGAAAPSSAPSSAPPAK
jgi:hypothetical protein